MRRIVTSATLALSLILGATVVPAATATAAAPTDTDTTNTSAADGITITSPKVVETVPGEDAIFPVQVDWPDTPMERLDFSWQYSKSSSASSWLGWLNVPAYQYGANSASSSTLSIAAAKIGEWPGYYFRAVVSRGGGKAYYSRSIRLATVPSPTMSLPADTTVEAGASASFRASAPTPPYTAVQWQKRARGSDEWTDAAATQPRDVFGDLVVTNVNPADDGTLYRPAFFTENGVPHYGREAKLTVTPSSILDGIYYSPALHGLRYYVKGVDQALATGMHTIDGKTYFVNNGSIQDGSVTDPLVPGGRAHFTIENGMTTNDFVLEDGRTERYYDGTGAMRTTAGYAVIRNKTYSFDADGNAVQVIAEKTVKGDSGPGALRIRIVQLGDVYTTVDFAATSSGPLGGAATDRVTVAVGGRAASFTLNQDADDVAKALTDHFRGFAGQTSVGEVQLKIVVGATTVLQEENVVTCPVPTGPSPRVVITNCFAQPVGPLPTLRQHLDGIYMGMTTTLRTLAPDAVASTLGADTDLVRANVALHTANPGQLTATTLADHFAPLIRLMTATETRLVQPALLNIHIQVRGVFRDELETAIQHFNAREMNALITQTTEIRTTLGTAQREMANDVPRAVREMAEQAVAGYVGAEYAGYVDAVDAINLDQLLALGPDAPGLQPLMQLNAQYTQAAAYEDGQRALTQETIDIHRRMVLILRTTPPQTNGVPNFFTYASLRDQARAALGLPGIQGR
jgi:hypothetical protein